MRLFSTVVLALVASVFSLQAGVIQMELTPFVDQTAPLTPYTAQELVASWWVTAPNVEGLDLYSMEVDLQTTGNVFLANLSLRSNSLIFGVLQPSPTNTFYFGPWIIPPNASIVLGLYVDIAGNSVGTLEADVPDGGLKALGLTSTFEYTSGAVFGGIHSVCDVCSGGGGGGGGPADPTPEPGTLGLVLAGVAVVAFQVRKK
jgi:hypothetical protein